VAAARYSALADEFAKRITPRLDHDAPWLFPCVVHKVCTVLPPLSTRFNLSPWSKNPIDWLSGDQNGSDAPSVPVTL
jgi:hypothetical protein